MHTFSGYNVNSVYTDMINTIMAEGQVVYPRNSVRKELHPVMVEIQNPSQRLVSAHGRAVNVAFALAEVIWILDGRNDVETLSYFNSQIKNYSDDGTTFNAPYGWRARYGFGHDQLADIVRVLKTDRDSTQATLVLSDPRFDRGFMQTAENGLYKHETKDRACNVLAHLMIRNHALDWLQIVRSNDAMWGTPYNWMQFTHLQEILAGRIGVAVGRYYHVADSLHVYDYHYEEAEALRRFDLYGHAYGYGDVPMPIEFTHESTVLHLARWVDTIRKFGITGDNVGEFKSQLATDQMLGPYWRAVIAVLGAYSLYKNKFDNLAFDMLATCKEPAYGLGQIRFFYHKRWHRAENKWIESMIDKLFPAEIAHWIRSGSEF